MIKGIMPRINEATDADLKVIERLQQIGWKWETHCFISRSMH
ncbi:MAG: hypothetical protein QMD44_04380 [Thermodesulfovibrionales bacterium]|nr:hypothetical protein [Thermodesulfovibrionales bacterium]